MSAQDELKATVQAMVQSGRAILARETTEPTSAEQLKAIALKSTEENRGPIEA